MIPLHDNIPARKFPAINWTIIVVNGLFFLMELTLPRETLESFFYHFGLVPARYSDPQAAINFGLNPYSYWPFLTTMFLHGGLAHFIGNMWTLYIFGDNVEDRMGRFRYLLFYILCGLCASFTHYYLNRYSNVPALGASGAISGVMAAYMFLFPGSKIVFFFPFFFIPYFFELSAFFYIGVWFITQLFSGTSTLGSADTTGIAFWAHIGGFIAGSILFKLFSRKEYRE
jgi:membrane associated rhomboid family serine protease